MSMLPGLKCVDIASGTNHLVILTENGLVYTIGCSEQAQLGGVYQTISTGDPGLVFLTKLSRVSCMTKKLFSI